jgi:hypothetical protein
MVSRILVTAILLLGLTACRLEAPQVTQGRVTHKHTESAYTWFEIREHGTPTQNTVVVHDEPKKYFLTVTACPPDWSCVDADTAVDQATYDATPTGSDYRIR